MPPAHIFIVYWIVTFVVSSRQCRRVVIGVGQLEGQAFKAETLKVDVKKLSLLDAAASVLRK